MSSISPENEQFIEQEIQAGHYQSRADAIEAGIQLLRQRRELLGRIDRAREQLDTGQYTEHDENSLARAFDQLKKRAEKAPKQ